MSAGSQRSERQLLRYEENHPVLFPEAHLRAMAQKIGRFQLLPNTLQATRRLIEPDIDRRFGWYREQARGVEFQGTLPLFGC